jgi:regulatory protein
VARHILLRRLTDQPRSRGELAQALARRRVPDDVATRVLDRFTEVGLIDDAAFATAWVESRQRGRGLAKRALAAELRAKGVDSETARAALDVVDADDERETARRLVRRRLPSFARQDRVVAQRRLVAMLARKGYSAGLAWSVVQNELAAGRDDDPDSTPDGDPYSEPSHDFSSDPSSDPYSGPDSDPHSDPGLDGVATSSEADSRLRARR